MLLAFFSALIGLQPNFLQIFFRTQFGREHEITAQTFLDSHKAERPSNHWVFIKDENNQRLPSRVSTLHRPSTSAPTATDHAGEGQNFQISNTDTT